MKLTLFRCAVLCALASSIPLGLSAVAQDSVSITLGTANVSNGLFLNETDGGWTTPVTAGGSQARSTTPPAGKTGQFMYFATDPAFANNGSVSNLWVTVEYFDQGTNAFRLEYDAQPDPNNINTDTDPYTVSNGGINNGLIYKYDTGRWLSYTFVLNNVWFGKRQPGNSDFRIDDWTIDATGTPVDGEGPEIIRKVTVSKTEPTAFHIKYATTPIKLDGVLDDPVWQSAQTFLLDMAAQDVIRPSVWKGTNDYSAVARFAWDTNYLYASFDVTDDIIRVSFDDPSQAWNGDGAEIFFGFDQSNPSRTAYLPATDFHIMMSAGPNPVYEIADLSGITYTNNPPDPFPPANSDVLVVQNRAAGLPSGYVLEARIPWTLLIALGPLDDPTLAVTNKVTPGQLVGFSIFGNDGDTPGAPNQDKAFSLTERPGPANNPSSWDTVQMDGPVALVGPAYAIGLNFGADEPNGGKLGGLAATDVAGVAGAAQSNWNNLSGIAGTNAALVASVAGVSQSTTATVSWTCPNTWSTFGRGETNNAFTGADRTLMLGYLDSGGNNTNTYATINGLPTQLTSSGYDVYVYAQGSVPGKGGSYRILDASTYAVLKDYVRAQSPTNATTYIEAIPSSATNVFAAGNYIHFSGLDSPNIIVQSVTAGTLGFDKATSPNPRAPIDAIQLVAPASTPPPPHLSLARSGTDVLITFTGTLQSSPTIPATFTDVTGATSPYKVPTTGTATFYRSKK